MHVTEPAGPGSEERTVALEGGISSGPESEGDLSSFLEAIAIRGRSWCFLDLARSGGLSMSHNEDLLLYVCLEGRVRLAGVSDAPIELIFGDVVIVLSGAAHTIRVEPGARAQFVEILQEKRAVDIPPVIRLGEGGEGAKLLCARLDVTWPAGAQGPALPPFVHISRHTNGSFRVEVLRLIAAGAGAAAVLTKLAGVMLALALRQHPQCPLLFRLTATQDPIARALELISHAPAENWTVATLAKRVGLARSKFAARFAKAVGRTPMDVVTERRMQMAASLLERSTLKVSDVSARVGYRSEAAFSRRFLRFYGMPPGRMRRALEGSEAEPYPPL